MLDSKPSCHGGIGAEEEGASPPAASHREQAQISRAEEEGAIHLSSHQEGAHEAHPNADLVPRGSPMGISSGEATSSSGIPEQSLEMVDLRKDPLLNASMGGNVMWAATDEDFYKPASSSGLAEILEGEKHQMRQAWGLLQKLGKDPKWQPADEDPDTWRAQLLNDLPDPERFRAGRLGERVEVLEEYFRIAGNKTKAATRVVRWLKHGIYCEFVPTDSPGQEAMPFSKKKKEIVRSMLQKAIPRGEAVENYLSGNRPRAVHFPNHKSTAQYASFVEEELQGMLRKGVVKEWAAPEPPVVINGLRVVDEKAPKLRLCLNPMYLNLFLRYQPLKYERLGDIPSLAEEGDFAFTTDDKSGYWQCPLHPAMWKYLCFQVGSKVYTWTHLPFGVAPACFIYTAIKQEIYRPLREAGLRMVFLIDDHISIQQGMTRTRTQCGAMCRLLAALGWTLSIPKCQLEPTQLAKFLGLMVDLAQRAFLVPGEKLRMLARQVDGLAAQSLISDRDIARLAGTVMALSPALELAPLLARGMMKAMQGQQRWDELYPTPAAFVADMTLLVDTAKAKAGEGRRWSLRQNTIQVVGDASETALAAFFPNGELPDIVIPFTKEEREAVASHTYSSTARELSVVGKVMITMEEQQPGILRDVRLQYATDSQPTMEDLMRMKGNANTFPIVREVRLLAARLGSDLEVIWRPREHELARRADDISKTLDKADWSLHPAVLRLVLGHPVVSGRSLSMDLFASPTNSVVPAAYYSLYMGPGCKGLDAFSQSWQQRADTELAYINGPFTKMDQILRKILEERVNAIVIAPVWPRPWTALLNQLPVKARMELPHREDLFLPGSLVPAAQRRPKAPRYKVLAYYILWPVLEEEC